MSKIYYVTGGARSGKSGFAEKIAENHGDVVYIATAVATDEEMENRIDIHKNSRPKEWETFEQYRDIDRILRSSDKKSFLLDCLTILTTNILMEYSLDGEGINPEKEKQITDVVMREIMNFVVAAKEGDKTLIVVSNEVGMGIVPEGKLSRFFRDLAGRANQLMSSLSDEAYLMVSGIPIRIKG